MKTVIKYVDPHQNVFWFEEEPLGSRNLYNYYGTVIAIRPGWETNINNWNVGDKISVVKCVCVIEDVPAEIKPIVWKEDNLEKFRIAAEILAQNKAEILKRSKEGIKFSEGI